MHSTYRDSSSRRISTKKTLSVAPNLARLFRHSRSNFPFPMCSIVLHNTVIILTGLSITVNDLTKSSLFGSTLMVNHVVLRNLYPYVNSTRLPPLRVHIVAPFPHITGLKPHPLLPFRDSSLNSLVLRSPVQYVFTLPQFISSINCSQSLLTWIRPQLLGAKCEQVANYSITKNAPLRATVLSNHHNLLPPGLRSAKERIAFRSSRPRTFRHKIPRI
jgi:hypothetical protein